MIGEKEEKRVKLRFHHLGEVYWISANGNGAVYDFITEDRIGTWDEDTNDIVLDDEDYDNEGSQTF